MKNKKKETNLHNPYNGIKCLEKKNTRGVLCVNSYNVKGGAIIQEDITPNSENRFDDDDSGKSNGKVVFRKH